MNYSLIILIGLVLAIIVVIAFVFFYNRSSVDTSDVLDDSDVPVAPSSLEYNKTYEPPKRNTNISCSASGGLKLKKYHKLTGDYYSIPDDENYKLI